MTLLGRDRRDEEFTCFVRDHGPALLRGARFLTGDTWQAEDLLQTGLAKTYLAWPAARGRVPYAYARQVMVTTHTDQWRRRRWRGPPRDHADPPEDVRAGNGDLAQGVAERDALDRALARLSPRERAVLVLRYSEDLTEKETARLLRVSAGTVKTLASRALAKLRNDPSLTTTAMTKEPTDVRH